MRKFGLIIVCMTIALFSYAQKEMPNILAKNLKGQTVETGTLAENGKIKIFSFWATWCAPCKKELDAISNLYDQWQTDYDLEVYAVSVDDARALAKVKPMVATKNWPFEVLTDVKQEFMRVLQFQTVPFTVIVDQQGSLVYEHNGYLPGDEFELEKEIQKLTQ